MVSGVEEVEEWPENTALGDAGVNRGKRVLGGAEADEEMPVEQEGLKEEEAERYAHSNVWLPRPTKWPHMTKGR
jgi:hypothetical protein